MTHRQLRDLAERSAEMMRDHLDLLTPREQSLLTDLWWKVDQGRFPTPHEHETLRRLLARGQQTVAPD
jgi:hypothetical protein